MCEGTDEHVRGNLTEKLGKWENGAMPEGGTLGKNDELYRKCRRKGENMRKRLKGAMPEGVT